VGEQGRVGQFEEEQRSVDAMYALLHSEVMARRAAQDRAVAAPVDAASERYALFFKDTPPTESIRQLQAA